MTAVDGLCKMVQAVHLAEIGRIMVQDAETGEYRHGHLDSIDPMPVVRFIAMHHIVDTGLDTLDAFGLGVDAEEVDPGLAGALIIGIAVGYAIAGHPV